MDCRALVGLDRGQLMADRQQLERTVIHAAPLRPQTFLGGEREPAQFALLLSFLIGFSGFIAMDWRIIALGATFGAGLIALLRQIAKVDPLMSAVYVAHTRLQRHYPPHSSPFRRD